MGKALSGELSCPCDRSCLGMSSAAVVSGTLRVKFQNAGIANFYKPVMRQHVLYAATLIFHLSDNFSCPLGIS